MGNWGACAQQGRCQQLPLQPNFERAREEVGLLDGRVSSHTELAQPTVFAGNGTPFFFFFFFEVMKNALHEINVFLQTNCYIYLCLALTIHRPYVSPHRL